MLDLVNFGVAKSPGACTMLYLRIAVERMWHMRDILALAFRQKDFSSLELFPPRPETFRMRDAHA